MKKIIYLIMILLPVMYVSCDTTGVLDEEVMGFTKLSSKVIYPEGLFDDYRVEFNGQNVKDVLFSREETEGELKVYYPKDATTPELTVPYNFAEQGTNIQLIRLPGKPIEFYKEADFIQFSTTMSLFEGYKAILKGQEIVNGVNYIKKDQTSGTLQFFKEGENSPVSSIEDFSIDAGSNFIILQASATDFVQLSADSDEEPAPASDAFSKVRFFYTPVDALNVDSIRIEFFTYDLDINAIDTDIPSVIVKKGELSPYIELNNNRYKESYNNPAGFGYSIYNAKTNELIEDGMISGNNMFELPRKDPYVTSYKFITYQLQNQIGYPPKLVEALSIKW